VSKKQVMIKNPTRKIPEASDNWVKQREKQKRLTFDAPASLHSELKIASARTGQKMGEIAMEALKEYLSKINHNHK